MVSPLRCFMKFFTQTSKEGGNEESPLGIRRLEILKEASCPGGPRPPHPSTPDVSPSLSNANTMAKSRSSSAPKRIVFSSSGASKPKSAAGGSKKANNVSGFAHRQAQRNPQLDENPLEVFDLVTQKHKRSNVDSALSRDEAGTGKGRASRPKDEDEMGGEEDVDEVRERIRKLVNGEEVGLVEDDDDEEVESDDAWEEGGHDQNSWGGAFLTNTKKAKSQVILLLGYIDQET
jgi:hypothetical protein